jgi:hypothetical protein
MALQTDFPEKKELPGHCEFHGGVGQFAIAGRTDHDGLKPLAKWNFRPFLVAHHLARGNYIDRI